MARPRTGGVALRDGHWYARITLHREPPKYGRAPRVEQVVERPDGKPVTEAYARARAANWQALYDAGTWLPHGDPVPAPTTTVEAWVGRWCERQTYTTAAQDRARVLHYLKGSVLAVKPVREVTPRDVAAWLAHARRTPSRRKTPPAERTVRNAYDVLRRALAGAVFEGLLTQDPCAVLPSDVTPRAVDARPERRRDYRLTRAEVEHADWIDERGRMVRERDAVLCAHFRAEIAARSAQPFRLFRTPAPAQPAAPPPGYFVADWDGFRKQKRAEAAKARRDAKKATA